MRSLARRPIGSFPMRVNYIEPVIMVATILRWLLLASITGAIVGTGVSLFLQALFFLSEHTAHLSLWTQMALLPLAGILNGLLLHYGYREPGSYARDSVITAIHTRSGAMSHKTILIKPVAALITLALGGSAGKEGPCSHIGGTLASSVPDAPLEPGKIHISYSLLRRQGYFRSNRWRK